VFKTILRDTRHSISILRTDRGGESTSKTFVKFLDDNSIQQELTAPYTLEQNAIAERDNRTIMEGVRSSIYQAKVDLSF
jgi:transposase InsO family protein